MSPNDIGRVIHLRKLANFLTLFRFAVGIPVIVALQRGDNSIAWVLISLGAVSDMADGYLARKAGGGTIWGARLDPLADKILLVAPLIYLARDLVIPLWAIWLLISRELIISGWRSSNLLGGPASMGGKVKTILQFSSILLMIWPYSWGGISFSDNLRELGYYLFWPSLFFAIFSALKYLNLQSTSHQS